jgi:chromosome segregation ATPase
MATTALNSWNAIKTRHEALSKDAKFKPDSLAPLCARLDDYGTQLAKQQDEKEKAGKVIDDAGDAFTACSKKIADKYDEIKQLTEQMAEAGMGEEDLTGDDAVKIVSKAAASFVNLAKELAEVAQAIAKASDEQAGIVKKMAEQFKAKREAVDNAIKRIQAEGSKTQDQIRKQVDVYRKTAIGMKDTGMAGDIGSLNSVVAQLYSFQ